MLHRHRHQVLVVPLIALAKLHLTVVAVIALAVSLLSPAAPAATDEPAQTRPFTVPHPGAQLWKDLRQGQGGTTRAEGQESGVLINAPDGAWAEGRPWDRGKSWLDFRVTELIPKGAMLLAGVLAAIALWYLLRGTLRIDGGRSGRVVPRTSRFERYAHWSMATLFIVLGLSGLVLLLGRNFLLPYLGADLKPLFGQFAYWCKTVHNYAGPLFPISVLAVFVGFVRHNLYARGDLLWALKGGGFFGGHASAGRFNLGEKAVFWLTMLLGTAISVTGVMLDFPAEFLATRADFQEAQILHAVVGVLFIGLIFGHIYLATLGVEGTLEGMTQGHVDENWARSHHDRWYEEVKHQARPADPDPAPASTSPGKQGGQTA